MALNRNARSMFRSQFIALTAFVFCAFGDALATPVSFSEVVDLGVEADHVWRPYGTHSQQTLVHFPQKGVNEPSVLLIHGGCWSNAYGVDHALPMAEALSELGLDVWAAEYRRVGDEGGGWRGSLDDIKSAIRYVAKQTGNSPLLIGHSAGGHLALKAGEDPALPVTGVVALAPITDLVSYGAETGSCQSMVPKFMGDESYEPSEAYRNASVSIDHISTPVKAILGDADPIVGTNQVKRFSPAQLINVPEAGHFDLIHPKTPAFEVVKLAVAKVFSETIDSREEPKNE